MKKSQLLIIMAVLTGLAVTARLLPHPANFTPVAAVALFAGCYLPKKWALILPVLIMLLSDFFIGFYELPLLLVVYSCFVLTGVAGFIIKKNRDVFSVLTSTLLVSLAFFLITNLAVWLFSSWYTHDWSGLLLCYSLAVPFFRNTLLGNLFFVAILFGSYELLRATLSEQKNTAESSII